MQLYIVLQLGKYAYYETIAKIITGENETTRNSLHKLSWGNVEWLPFWG